MYLVEKRHEKEDLLENQKNEYQNLKNHQQPKEEILMDKI